MANRRDFKTPVAAFEDREAPSTLTIKWCGQFHDCEIGHSPLDVVAWHGNYAPCKYDLQHLLPGRRDPVRPPRPVDLHRADRALGRRGDREHRLRAVPRPLERGRGHVPPALVPQERHVRADGQHPRPVRRQAAGLRPRRHEPAQLHAAARPGPRGVRGRVERRPRARTSSSRHDVLHVRDPLPAAPDRVRRERGAAAGRLRRLLGRPREEVRRHARA